MKRRHSEGGSEDEEVAKRTKNSASPVGDLTMKASLLLPPAPSKTFTPHVVTSKEFRESAQVVVAHLPFFAACSTALIHWLANELEVRLYSAGEVLYRQGDVMPDLIIISRGVVDIKIDDAHDSTRGSGFLADSSLFEASPKGSTALALTEVEVLVISLASLEKALDLFHSDRANTMEAVAQFRSLAPPQQAALAAASTMANPGVPKSPLQAERLRYKPTQPGVFGRAAIDSVTLCLGSPSAAVADASAIHNLFPLTYGLPAVHFFSGSMGATSEMSDHSLAPGPTKVSDSEPLRIGVVLSGGQAPGGHNVIAALFDYVKAASPHGKVFGFLRGPRGVFQGDYIEITRARMDSYRNQGGFDIIASGRDKIKSADQFAKSAAVVTKLGLHGLVVIGGDDSNTNAALLAEDFAARRLATRVVGVPKTIDGDLRSAQVEVSFGFDTACKVYSEAIGNVAIDASSTRKYYHFIRLMGRSASHITLECALRTRPNVALIGEEVAAAGETLASITTKLCDVICARAAQGNNFGLILAPEGLIEFVGEVGSLIAEVNEVLAHGTPNTFEAVAAALSEPSARVFTFLPRPIAEQLLLERDPHGNVQVARIETERLLILLCETELASRKAAGTYTGTFLTQSHYFGYEGRSALPSNFDADYCAALGTTAGFLVDHGATGYMAVVANVAAPTEQWQPGGWPLTAMMNVERRHGENVPVIKKALVELDSPNFLVFAQVREGWATANAFRSPGPIQFGGPTADDRSFYVSPPTAAALAASHLSGSELTAGPAPWISNPESNRSTLAAARGRSTLTLPTVLKGPVYLKESIRVAPEDSESLEGVLTHFPNLTQQADNGVPVIEIEPGTTHLSHDVNTRGKTVGVCFCGRQAPGGNNIVVGLFEFLAHNGGGTLLGFVGGSAGLLSNTVVEVTESYVAGWRNQGGYSLGRTKDKLRTAAELEAARQTCLARRLDVLVLVGGPHTHTDATLLSEYFLASGTSTRVIVTGSSVDNDLTSSLIHGTVGFDTACKVYSQLIGNIMTDAASAIKYYYFIRLVGRSPSHVVLECALQTQPNFVVIGEAAAAHGLTLNDIVKQIADGVVQRSQLGIHHGIVLIPEGLLSHLPHFQTLFAEIQRIVSDGSSSLASGGDEEAVSSRLSPWSLALFKSLPRDIRAQVLAERESDGSVQMSQIETERLLASMVAEELVTRKVAGTYKGSFSAITHFFGYQGRSSMPSSFDCHLGLTLGYGAGLLGVSGFTGMTVSVRGITGPVEQWSIGGVPLTALMKVHVGPSPWGDNHPVVPVRGVDLRSRSFRALASRSTEWMLVDHYTNPGPIQFYGALAGARSATLEAEHGDVVERLHQIRDLCLEIERTCTFNARRDILDTAVTSLGALSTILGILRRSGSL